MVKRPKKVQKGQKNYMTNENYQEFAEEQFKNIYDYLDELYGEILFKKLNNTGTSITLSDDAGKYEYFKIFYTVNRGDGHVIHGSQDVLSPDNSYFNVNAAYRTSAIVGCTTLYKIEGKSITLTAGANYEMRGGQYPSTNNNNSIFITQVIGYKRKE